MTPAIESIDFENLIASFAGSRFLSVLEPFAFPEFNSRTSSPKGSLRPSIYGQYFGEALVLDREARTPDIRSYDLFGVTLELRDHSQQVYSLAVPGIREGTPLVSLGASIMLRQLLLDPATNLPRGMNA